MARRDYMRDRAMSRDSRRGVRGSGRGRDRYSRYNDYREREMMDERNPYGSRGGYVVSSRRDRDDERRDYERDYARDYERRDYNRNYDYSDYAEDRRYSRDYRDYASDDMDEEYEKDLKEWTKKLKKHDRFGLSENELINKAKSMGVKFDEYSEEEFIATYYMMQSDYKNVGNDAHIYLQMAKSFLEDKDAEKQGSEKLCIYMYEIVKGDGK